MPPLGPFNGKSFGTTISPWIIMADALRPFLLPVPQRQKATADHFSKQGDLAHYGVNLTATINASESSTTVCRSRLDWIYWTMNDMVAHQTSNGCTIVPGDLLATGTVSGTEKGSHACLLEITRGGKESLTLSDGSQRTYLHDGDTVILGGWAGELGSDNCVGFGSCFGTLRPALLP
jgi:fumarylacetoacetase